MNRIKGGEEIATGGWARLGGAGFGGVGSGAGGPRAPGSVAHPSGCLPGTSIPKRNPSSARSAGRDSASPGPWRSTKPYTCR